MLRSAMPLSHALIQALQQAGAPQANAEYDSYAEFRAGMNAGLSLQASYSLRPCPEAQTRRPLGANDMPYDLRTSGTALPQI